MRNAIGVAWTMLCASAVLLGLLLLTMGVIAAVVLLFVAVAAGVDPLPLGR